MNRTHLLALLILAPAAASCCAEPPPVVEPPPPVVIDLRPPPTPEPPPRPAEPAPLAVAADDDEPVPFHCAGGELIVAGDRPYCIEATPATFHESERWCAANGGHLGRPGSDDENRALGRALGSPVGFEGGAWFGLVSPRGRQWLWSTGAPVVFTSWAPGEPNNAGGDENCGELYVRRAQWNDLACDRPMPYVCESRPARPGAAPPALRCSGTPFRAGGIDYCIEPEQVPWIGAEHACKKQGGTLASLRTREENEAFRVAVGGHFGFDRVWLGLTDEGHQGRWTTVTGRRMTYAHWRPGEPNNAGGNEHCVEWYTSDAGWNDIRCDQPHVGICSPR
jgi:hypothetical protein